MLFAGNRVHWKIYKFVFDNKNKNLMLLILGFLGLKINYDKTFK